MEKGVKVIAEECTVDYSNDYRTLVTKAKAVNPDLWLVTTSLPANFLRARYELKVGIPTLMTNVIIDALEVERISREVAVGVYFTNWPQSEKFINSFKTLYDTHPIIEAENSYEAVRSLAKAFTDNQEDVLVGLRQVKYQGVGGLVDFTSSNHTQINKAEAKLYRVDVSGYTEF